MGVEDVMSRIGAMSEEQVIQRMSAILADLPPGSAPLVKMRHCMDKAIKWEGNPAREEDMGLASSMALVFAAEQVVVLGAKLAAKLSVVE